MQSVDLQQLEDDPIEALQRAHQGPLVVLEGDRAEAVVFHLDPSQLRDQQSGLSLAVAVALYKDGAVSLGRAARLASVSVSEILIHLSRLGIAVTTDEPGAGDADMETLDRWLASS